MTRFRDLFCYVVVWVTLAYLQETHAVLYVGLLRQVGRNDDLVGCSLMLRAALSVSSIMLLCYVGMREPHRFDLLTHMPRWRWARRDGAHHPILRFSFSLCQ